MTSCNNPGLMEQELLTIPEHLSSLPFLWGSCCSIFSFLCSVLRTIVWPFVLFILDIVLFVLRFTASDYLLGILKLLLCLIYTLALTIQYK